MCVITTYGVHCLVAGFGVQVQSSRLCVQEEGCCALCNILLPGRIAACPAPDLQQTGTEALHTIGGSLELLVMGIEVPETC